MKTLKDIDRDYIDSLTQTFVELEKTHNTLLKSYHFDLTKTEITEAIIERLKTYYLTQTNIKTFLEKRYLATASDFFVETVLFYLRLFLEKQGGQLKAHFTAVRTSRQELGKRVLTEYDALNIAYLPDQFSISNVRKPDNTEEEKARVVS